MATSKEFDFAKLYVCLLGTFAVAFCRHLLYVAFLNRSDTTGVRLGNPLHWTLIGDEIQLICPSNQTREATAGVFFHQLTFPNPAVLPDGSQVTFRQSPQYFEIGLTRVTFIATDFFDTEYTCHFYVNLAVPDNTPPSLICPDNQTVYLSDGGQQAVQNVTLPPPIHAVDGSGGIVRLSYSPPSGSDFSLGATDVRLTASDPNGNSENCAFFVIVKRPLDTTPPNLTCPPDQIKVRPQDGSCYLLVEYPQPIATDDSGDDVIIQTYPSSGGTFDTCTNYDGMTIFASARDFSGNEATCTFHLFWSDGITTMSAGTTTRPTTVGRTTRPATTRPATTTKPPTTTRPTTTRQPTTTKQPATTRPVATTVPPTTTRPITTTKAPTTTRPPTTTRQPTTTRPPTTTTQPTTTRPPTTTTQPTTTRPPTTTTQPTTTRPPTTTTQPTTTRPPTTTTQPTTTRPTPTTMLPPTRPSTTTKPTTTRPSTTTKAPSTTRPSTTTKPPTTTRPSTTTRSPTTTRPPTTTKSPTTTRPTTKPVTYTPSKKTKKPMTTRKTTTKSLFIDICLPNPCLNKGVCFRDTENTVINCVCQRGYVGERCELSPTTSGMNKGLNSTAVSPADPQIVSSAIIGIIVGALGLVLIVFVMLTCIVCCNNSGQSKKKPDLGKAVEAHLNPVFTLDPLELDDDKRTGSGGTSGGGGGTESEEDEEDDYDNAKNLLASVMKPAAVEHLYSKGPAPAAPVRHTKPSIPTNHVKPSIPVKRVKPIIPVQPVKPTIPIVTHVDDTDDDDDAKSTHSDHSYQSIDGTTKRVVFVELHRSDSDAERPFADDDTDEDIVQKIFDTEGLVRIPSTLTNYSQMSLKMSGSRMNNRYTERV